MLHYECIVDLLLAGTVLSKSWNVADSILWPFSSLDIEVEMSTDTGISAAHMSNSISLKPMNQATHDQAP